MSLVFEEPPGQEGPAARFRERSPERKELDNMLSQLTGYPDQWARLYDFPSEAKEDAEKMAGKVRSAAGYLNTGKSWSVTVRQKGDGWSVFAKMSSEPARTRKKAEPKAQTPPEPQNPVITASVTDPEQVREPTFQ